MKGLTWYFMAFVVAPGIAHEETVDLIRLFKRQPSTCSTIESPSINVFFLEDFWALDFHCFSSSLCLLLHLK